MSELEIVECFVDFWIDENEVQEDKLKEIENRIKEIGSEYDIIPEITLNKQSKTKKQEYYEIKIRYIFKNYRINEFFEDEVEDYLNSSYGEK